MIYLDNSSTTRPSPEVIKAMAQVMEKYWGNPSSLHRLGLEAEKILKQAREIIACSLGASAEEIVFTSGGTESNNIFLKGILNAYSGRGKHIICSKVEHPSVLEVVKTFEKKGYDVTWLGVDQYGSVSLEELQESLREDTILTAIMHVNNETGTIQPVTEAGQIIKKYSKSFFYVDGVQGYLKVSLDLKKSLIDGYGISAHKIHGPKGTGALYIKKNLRISPLLEGGGQEKGLRSGTENLQGIAGMAKTVKHLDSFYKGRYEENLSNRKKLINLLQEVIPEIKVNSALGKNSSPYILNCSLPGVRGETLLHILEEDEIYVSTGSACSGKDRSYSHVLKEMGLAEDYLMGSIRISMNVLDWPKEEDVNFFANK